MPRFQPQSFSNILQRMANRVVARSELTDLNEGGNVHTTLAAVARELDDINFQMTNLQQIWDIDTATEEDLDARGADIPPDKLERNGATKAAATQTFSRSDTATLVTIPAGSIVRVADGPEFTTDSVATISIGFTTSPAVGITASEAGAAGNVDAATITALDAISGVETTTNPTAATGGSDVEADPEYRERIKTYIRSLPRGVVDALKFAVLDASLDGFGRIVSTEVVELQVPNLGIVHVFVDDGAGTVSKVDDNYGSAETVVASATGGEVRMFLDSVPVVEGTTFTLEINAVGQTEGVDFTLNRATGQITLDPTVFPTGLTATDAVTAEYTWYIGLIAEAQKIVDGDPGDRVNYPGYRAAGTQVFVKPPTTLQQIVQAQITIDTDFIGTQTLVRDQVRAAINRYINGLGINGDVIRTELIFQAQTVAGVVDVIFVEPPANVIIGDGELARITNANIDLT
jgi:uncharacterized phage protein gp47/JayE